MASKARTDGGQTVRIALADDHAVNPGERTAPYMI